MRHHALRFLLTTSLAIVTTSAAAAQADLPDGVTEQTIAEGKALFSGAGLCFACHGPDGSGMPNLGADLTDSEWSQSEGSFEEILATIIEGVTPEKSTTGTMMLAKGGSSLNDDQLKAVAAYVWSLSRKKE